jgi:hypothetical protein
MQKLVGLSGLEPPTLRLSGARSNHLSYKPVCTELPVYVLPPGPLGLAVRRYYALFTLLNFAGSLPAVPHSVMYVMPRHSRGGDEEV